MEYDAFADTTEAEEDYDSSEEFFGSVEIGPRIEAASKCNSRIGKKSQSKARVPLQK